MIIFHILTLFIFWEHPDNRFKDNVRKFLAGEMSGEEFIRRCNIIKP